MDKEAPSTTSTKGYVASLVVAVELVLVRTADVDLVDLLVAAAVAPAAVAEGTKVSNAPSRTINAGGHPPPTVALCAWYASRGVIRPLIAGIASTKTTSQMND